MTIFFNHIILFNYDNPFQLLQSFSIIIILFNYHNPFQLSRPFLIITIFFNLFTACDTIFVKIGQPIHHLTRIFYRQNMTKILWQFPKFLIYAFFFEFFSFLSNNFFTI